MLLEPVRSDPKNSKRIRGSFGGFICGYRASEPGGLRSWTDGRGTLDFTLRLPEGKKIRFVRCHMRHF